MEQALYGPLAPSRESGLKYFGSADYSAAVKAGHTNLEIFNWINSNFSKFTPGAGNQPGAGGLYDRIQSSAQNEQSVAAQNRQRELDIARAEQLQREAEARQLERQKQMEIGARTQAANTARAGLQSSMQIRSQPKSTKTAGTQGFKRRQNASKPYCL